MNSSTPFAITLQPSSGLANRTGSWRTQMPVYNRHLPPCNATCSAGENIQEWLYLAEEGKYEEAWQAVMRDNPLPATMGRCCYHSCETACNRGKLDQAVSIHAVERFLGDQAIKNNWKLEAPKARGTRVLVIGTGPSGLSCAYHLARLGHSVVMYEAGKKAGGMMRYGIPQYRLPRDILDAEIARIESLGVIIHRNKKCTDILESMKQEGADAAFLAIGAHLSKRIDIPAAEAGKVLDAVSFLRQASDAPDRSSLKVGRRVAIYGGGNTAMDAARTAKRLGAEETVIIYRRDQKHMPAHPIELEEALQEGVIVNWLRTIKQIDGDEIQVEAMTIENGKAVPTGKFETIKADMLILALGQDSESDFLRNVPGLSVASDGVVEVDPRMMTGYKGLFAGGDMVPADRTVTTAVGHGKKAARNIDAYLRGESLAATTKNALAPFERLNTWYYSDAPKSLQPHLDLIRRQSTFDETTHGLDETNALYEARRCLSCGNCFECDNCYGVCPDNAVIKLGGSAKFAINLDYCKGCGLCAAECPAGVIDMVKQSI